MHDMSGVQVRTIYCLWVDYGDDATRMIRAYANEHTANRQCESERRIAKKLSKQHSYWVTDEQFFDISEDTRIQQLIEEVAELKEFIAQ